MHTIICIVKYQKLIGIAHYCGHVAAVEEFALQTFSQTRAKSDGFKATSYTARLAPNFHQKHFQPTVTVFCGVPP
jgi:hypothetical protein